MHVLPTLDSEYLNARADECPAIAEDRGGRIVRYRGGVYMVIGYYVACEAADERVLCYILRAPWRMGRSEVVS